VTGTIANIDQGPAKMAGDSHAGERGSHSAGWYTLVLTVEVRDLAVEEVEEWTDGRGG